MEEPILHLAPHENPLRRRTDLDGEAVFFEANCFGRVREFVGQSINEDGYGNAYFAQLRDEPQRGTFVCSGYGKGSQGWAQPYLDWGRCTRESIVQTLKESIELEAWGRYFVLDKSLNLVAANEGCSTLFLNWNGLGMFHEDGGSFARFNWNQSCLEELWSLSVGELLEQFVAQIQQQDSEPQFALWWASLSNAEHFDLIFPLSRGTYQEWQNICRLLPIALFQPTDATDAKSYFRFSVDGELKAEIYHQSGRHAYQLIENLPLQKLSRWLHHYFSPKLNDKLSAHYLCAQQWAQSPQHPVCEVRLGARTQHERLEALLQLRDWLRDKAAPAEIDALLRAD